MNFKEHLKNITKANNNNMLAIFVGAGISKSSENFSVKIPTWSDLIKDLKDALDLSTEENDFLRIAQLYFLEFGEYTYYEKLNNYFPNNIEPSLVHKLIFDINPQHIITTNWDTILEKTIENNAYIYDVISSDQDLVKSTLPKKLIKMHGDFKNHNIVFKEDDYLSYQDNFPLIENYIKSILSTHTILFLGYSYNDVNLKQIMKWLQNRSKVSLPKYLISDTQNSIQKKYLQNHSIILVSNDEDKKFNCLNDIRSRKTATFLDLLVNPSRIDSKLNNDLNDDEIVEHIYDKLKILNDLDGILLEQIQNVLTNCGFIYTNDEKNNALIILEFYSNQLTVDLDEEERLIHKKFVGILKRYDEGECQNINIEKIFSILIKANIDGISISDEEYVDIKKNINSPVLQIVDICFDFSFGDTFEKVIPEMVELAYQYYQIKNYENAYNTLEKVITLCLKQRNYTQLFLSMFNKNLLLQGLKYSFTSNNRDKYQYIKEYDLAEKFYNLPKDLQIALQPIYDFVNFDYLYKSAFKVSSELKEKEDKNKIIEQGGMVFKRNELKTALKHKNLVAFSLKNKMMLEHRVEYKTINKYFIKIAIIIQAQSEHTSLNKIELYSCIKFIDNKELGVLFEKFYANDSDKKTNLKIFDENTEWLIEKVLPNLGRLFRKSNNIINNHEEYLKNVIFILSLVSLEQEQIEKIMSIFLEIISEAKNTIGVYESINQFLGMQYDLFESKINNEVLIKLIEVIINKLVCDKYNGFDYHAITRNSIYNLYGYARENKTVFNNKDLVSRLLLKLKIFDIREKTKISQSLLLSIYDISNRAIQNDIKQFLLDINLQQEDDIEEYIVFELSLVAYKIKEFDNGVIDKLNKYMTRFDGGTGFSSVLYTLKNLLESLVNKMSHKQFKDILEKTNQAIENFEKVKRIPIF